MHMEILCCCNSQISPFGGGLNKGASYIILHLVLRYLKGHGVGKSEEDSQRKRGLVASVAP